jgi:hypothetical protein
MERGAGWLIGAGVLALLVVCSGLGGALFYVGARRAGTERAAAEAQAREMEARARELEAQAREAERRAEEERWRAIQAERVAQEAAGGDPTSAGPLERTSAVTDVARAVSPRLRTCFERVLRTDPGATVRATMTLVYGADGALRSADATEVEVSPASLDGTAFVACVERAYAGTTIPAGPDELRVELPLVFTGS